MLSGDAPGYKLTRTDGTGVLSLVALGCGPASLSGSNSPEWMPGCLPMFLCHAAVPGDGRDCQHPGVGTTGERKRHRDVS